MPNKIHCYCRLAALVALLGYLIHSTLTRLDYFKTIRTLNQNSCKTIDIHLPVEDLEIFKDEFYWEAYLIISHSLSSAREKDLRMGPLLHGDLMILRIHSIWFDSRSSLRE